MGIDERRKERGYVVVFVVVVVVVNGVWVYVCMYLWGGGKMLNLLLLGIGR